MDTITFEDFHKVQFRSGTIVKAEEFPKARKPSYKIWADFGNHIGILQTSAQITVNYRTDNLVGKKIIGCVNLGEKNIAGFISQFLIVGFTDSNGAISLATSDLEVPNGNKLY